MPTQRKGRGRFRALRFQFNVTIGTLASGVMLSTAIGVGQGQEYWAISVDLATSLENVTEQTGGPLAFGFAHSDYTPTELDEWYEATNTMTGDTQQQEHGKRKVRDTGIFQTQAGTLAVQNFNDGNLKRTKLGFRVEDTKTVAIWQRNMGDSSYATTVPIMRGYGKLYLKML